MTTTETITFLREFNRWRRGDNDIEQPCALEVGRAIDAACDQIELLQQMAPELVTRHSPLVTSP